MHISGCDVRKWFKDAAVRHHLPVPDLRECETIAGNLNLIAGWPPFLQRGPVLGQAEKHGRLFLRHLPEAREKISRVRLDPLVHPDSLPWFLRVLAEMDAARRHVENLLSMLDWPVAKRSWHITARAIRGMAMTAWCGAGKMPRAVNSDDPVCGFVHAALEAMGTHKTPEAVSAALRGRRGGGGRRRTKRGTRNVLISDAENDANERIAPASRRVP